MKLSIFEKIYYKLSSLWYFFCLKRRMDKIKRPHKKYEDAILKTNPTLYWTGTANSVKVYDHALTPKEIVEHYEDSKK